MLSQAQRQTLEAICDTFVPSIDAPDAAAVQREFFARPASWLGVPAQLETLLAQAPSPTDASAFGQLIDTIGRDGFADQPRELRTAILRAAAAASPGAKLGLRQLRSLTLLFSYALADKRGRNPNWDALGYPGPLSAPPSPEHVPKTIGIERISGARATLDADVCVVGSGAGGSVIAAELQQAGHSVLVLEMGHYRSESDFTQLELAGLHELFLGAGLVSSEDGSIALLAGSTLGGGTVVNWMNCVRPPRHIRTEWAAMGLRGLGTAEFETHIDAIWRRLSVSDRTTSQNRTHQKLITACQRLGYAHRALARNAGLSCAGSRMCGYCTTGCQTGGKQSAVRTFLQDAWNAGARFTVGTYAEEILTENGRAAGVAATVTHSDGSTTALTVNAPSVVVAGGGIESPALLLRSGIGGPAVGKYLRVHPSAAVLGVYADPIESWIGQPQSAWCEEFHRCEGAHGFVIEGGAVFPGIMAASLPWLDGERHKELLSRTFRHSAPWVALVRDHGSGEVTIDGHGRAVLRWGLRDELDVMLFRRAMVELASLHQAAGAQEIITLFQDPVLWRDGEHFGRFLGKIETGSLAPNDIAVFSAHQMGSCRMGSDPLSSVADGDGQLHDTPGVWIGDASAFPTAPGVNPMISVMSLAHRTATHINAAVQHY